MRLGRIQKLIIDYLADGERGYIGVGVNVKYFPNCYIEDVEQAIDRLANRGIVKKLVPHGFYQLNKEHKNA